MVLTTLASLATFQAVFIAAVASASRSLAMAAVSSQLMALGSGFATAEGSTRNKTVFSKCSGMPFFLSAARRYENSANWSLQHQGDGLI